MKEIKFHPGTDTNDFEYKLKQIRGFLQEGCKVKLTLQYRGRENQHRELGEDMIARVLDMLKDECFVEQAPKTLGRIHGCLIGPPRTKKGGGKPQISVSGNPPPQPAQPPAEPEKGGGIHISIG